MATPRRESGYAGDRKHVKMADLKFVDLLRTNDTLEFTYKERLFEADVSLTGRIRCKRESHHSRFDEQDDDYSYYATPSNFTNDCVTVYWNGDGTCRTNPSGYERVRHVQSNHSLNELRDTYMQRYVRGKMSDVVTSTTSSDSNDGMQPRDPARVLEAIRSRAPTRHTKRRRTTTPTPPPSQHTTSDADNDDDDDISLVRGGNETTPLNAACVGTAAAHIVHDRESSVATVRARGRVPGYKGIADWLQGKLAAQNRIIVQMITYVQQCVDNNALSNGARVTADAMIDAFVRTSDELSSDEIALDIVATPLLDEANLPSAPKKRKRNEPALRDLVDDSFCAAYK